LQLPALCGRLDVPTGTQALAATAAAYPCARKILVVDDEPLIADLLTELLTIHGQNVQKSYSGSAALLIARHFRPDILISDVTMSGMDGVETALRIRDYAPQCQVLLVTAEVAAARVLLRKRLFNGQVEIVAKPVHSRQLLQIIAAARGPCN
jgi:CheY-like chemotaxis protein